MMTVLPYIYVGAGVLFALYFVILWIYCRRIPAFGWFWLISGIVFMGIGMGFESVLAIDPGTVQQSDIQRTLVVFTGITLCVIIYSVIGGGILSFYGNRKAGPGADYVIVLGARVNGRVPSKALRNRIMTAYEYLEKNPETKAVLTGGKGPGEEITEAACMMEMLLKLGVAGERLILEQKSRTTRENIGFARDLIGSRCRENDTFVVVVTSDFHALRGRVIGEMMRFRRVESLGAPSSKIMKPHYYMREILSWVKFGISMVLTEKKTNKIDRTGEGK